MVKSYLRHGPTQAFGLICSASSNSVYDGKRAYVPALEDVLVWDVKKGQQLAMWHETGHRSEVTCIVQSPQPDVFAVGYSDGSIRLWSASKSSVVATFNGHKKAVTVLTFDHTGTRLASGSQDTNLIVWDVVGEAGLYRLRGHRDQITAIQFLQVRSDLPSTSTSPNASLLLTTSKDTFLKVWDLSTQHCVQTIVAHRSEVSSMALDPDMQLVFTGSNDGEVKAWRLDHDALAAGLVETETGEVAKMLHPLSGLPISSSHRVNQMHFHPTQPFLAVQSSDKSVEIFRIRTIDEVKKKQLRRKKREKEKKQGAEGKANGKQPKNEDEDDDDLSQIKLQDLYTPYMIVRSGGKIRSFSFADNQQNSKAVQLFLSLSNNALEVHSVPLPVKKSEEPVEPSRLYSVELPGHRADVRTLCLSSDDLLLASASNGQLKIWNVKTTTCIRTMECGAAVCSTFLPGDRYIAVGTKSGEILIYDVASSSLIDTCKAHSGTVWSLHVRPDGSGLVSGSADKDVKFWNIEEQAAQSDDSSKHLGIVHIKTLKMTDDVLSVRYSPNGKVLAVALLDSTVKVFFADTLKFFLSLYGHKLPVLSMDISDDSKLIVTCSADKNVKIWGLDFGDCHKSIFAHDESVMQVRFEKDTHNFWTVGKDKMLKYWDGDKFENIQKLEGHHNEIWALTVSNRGEFVVTGSHDKSIRIWEKLDEELFLEEEREKELEALYEADTAQHLNRDNSPNPDGAEEATAVAKQTAQTLMAGEQIIEALDLADSERAVFQEYEESLARMGEGAHLKLQPPPRDPTLAAYDLEPDAYVLRVVSKIPGTALQDALLVLPFSKVVSLMVYLDLWAQKNWNIVLVSRILFFVLRTHHHQIVANRVMRTSLLALRRHLRDALCQEKDRISYNLAALGYIKRQNDAERLALFYEEEGMDEDKVKARIAEGKKRKRVQL